MHGSLAKFTATAGTQRPSKFTDKLKAIANSMEGSKKTQAAAAAAHASRKETIERVGMLPRADEDGFLQRGDEGEFAQDDDEDFPATPPDQRPSQPDFPEF